MAKKERYVLFVDESGKSKISDAGDHFLLSSIILNKDLHTALSSYMVSLKEKSEVPTDENIHAFDLFENEKVRNKRLVYSQINTFFGRLSSLIEGADIRCLIFRVDKSPFKKLVEKEARKKGVSEKTITNYLKRNGLHDFLYESLTRKIVLEFGHFLEQEDAQGEVIAESRRQDDEAVLRGFISATHESTFASGTVYQTWARSSLKRIHSLTFQNKKGLSFGLEIADLFGWAHYNNEYGKSRSYPSAAKNNRVDTKLKAVEEIMQNLCRKRPEDITQTKLKTLAADRVSEFTEALNLYKAPTVSSGTPPGNPGRP